MRRLDSDVLSRQDRPQPEECCQVLESGRIILFEETPFAMPQDSIEFLISQRQDHSPYHKNISYRPLTDQLKGARRESANQTDRLRSVMREYSQRVTDFVGSLLSPYRAGWRLDFASFRPIEEDGRPLPPKKRNDLLHVDAFPTRPTHGDRILRVFTNISPDKPRHWKVAGPFEELAKRYANDAGLAEIAGLGRRLPGGLQRTMSQMAAGLGWIGPARSPYDKFMLRFHDFLKASSDFQTGFQKHSIAFGPNRTWLVFTDAIAHAVLSGQFALEQTYIVPLHCLVNPQAAPIRILESLCDARLA